MNFVSRSWLKKEEKKKENEIKRDFYEEYKRIMNSYKVRGNYLITYNNEITIDRQLKRY